MRAAKIAIGVALTVAILASPSSAQPTGEDHYQLFVEGDLTVGSTIQFHLWAQPILPTHLQPVLQVTGPLALLESPESPISLPSGERTIVSWTASITGPGFWSATLSGQASQEGEATPFRVQPIRGHSYEGGANATGDHMPLSLRSDGFDEFGWDGLNRDYLPIIAPAWSATDKAVDLQFKVGHNASWAEDVRSITLEANVARALTDDEAKNCQNRCTTPELIANKQWTFAGRGVQEWTTSWDLPEGNIYHMQISMRHEIDDGFNPRFQYSWGCIYMVQIDRTDGGLELSEPDLFSRFFDRDCDNHQVAFGEVAVSTIGPGPIGVGLYPPWSKPPEPPKPTPTASQTPTPTTAPTVAEPDKESPIPLLLVPVALLVARRFS